MADLKSQLEISADATGVEVGVGKAKKSLEGLGAAASAAGKQASGGLDKVAQGADSSAKRVEAATRNIQNAIQRAISAQQSKGGAPSDFFRNLGLQRGADLTALKPLLDQLDAVKAKTQTVAEGFAALGAQGQANLKRINASDFLIAGLSQTSKQVTTTNQALRAGGVQFNEYGLSAKQTAAALRQVPAQLTDIFVSLQGGQAPLTVLLQQGGQLRDVFGGIRPAAAALGNALVSLINPYTLAAAAATAFAVAVYKGTQQSKEFQDAILLSGNYAGITEGRFNSLAKTLASSTQSSVANAREFAQALIATGQIGPQVFDKAAEAAIRLGSATGKSAKDVAADFAKMAESPAKFAAEYNKATNIFSAAQLRLIKDLEDSGRSIEAQGIFYDALNNRLHGIDENLGFLAKSIKLTAQGFSDMWDAALNFGRADTIEDKIRDVQKRIDAARAGRVAFGSQGAGFIGPDESATTGLKLEERDLFRQKEIKDGAAAAQAAMGRLNKEGKTAGDFVEGVLKRSQSVDQLKERLKNAQAEAERSFKALALVGSPVSDKDKQAVLEQLKKDFAGPKGSKPPVNTGIEQLRKAQLASDIDAIQNANKLLLNSQVNSDRLIEAQRAAGLLSDQQYYDAKRKFITDQTALQEDALKKEIARYGQEKFVGKTREEADAKRVENNKKIADAETKLAILHADSTAKLAVLSTQQEAAAKRLELSFLSARQAAQDYFDSVEKQQARDLAGVGKGTEQRQRNAGLSQVEDRFASQRRDLENQKAQLELEDKFTDDAKKQYDQRLAIINEFQSKSIASFNRYYDELIAKQKDFSVGATEALANYVSESANLAKHTEGLFTKAFQGIEDALTGFVTTGKLSFKSLADSIVADITRIIIKQDITGPLATAIQGGFKSGDGIGGLLSKGLGGLFGKPDAIGIAGKATETSAVAAHTAAETAAAAAITAAQVSSSASMAALTASAYQAAAALAAVAGSSGMAAAGSSGVGLLGLGGLIGGGGGFGTGANFGNMDLGAFLADGTNYVPRDNFPAILHKGEAVVPAKFNPAAGGNAPSNSQTINLNYHAAPGESRNTRLQNAREMGREAALAMLRNN